MGIWRGGKALEIAVVLQRKPGAPWEPPPAASSLRREHEPFGFSVEDPPKDDGDHGRGVRVASIDLRSSAYRAGLRQGDLILQVDGEPLIDKSAYRKAISALGAGVSRLYVRRGGKALFFGLRREPGNARAEAGGAGGAAR
jgi:S1-C subfamily serine protease